MPDQEYIHRSLRAAVEAKDSGFTGTSQAFLSLAVAEGASKTEILQVYADPIRHRTEADRKLVTTFDLP